MRINASILYTPRIVESFYSFDHRKIKTSEIITKFIKILNSSVTPPTVLKFSYYTSALKKNEGKGKKRKKEKHLWVSSPVHSTCCTLPARISMSGLMVTDLSGDFSLLA